MIGFANIANAQSDTDESLGDESVEVLQDSQFEIVKERVNSLEKASRRFDKIPPQPDLTSEKKTFEYDVQDFEIDFPEYNPRIRMLKIKNEGVPNYTSNYLRLGFGNYTSPYFEGFLANQASKEYNWGVHANHRSFVQGPVDGKNSGESSSDIALFGQYFGKVVNVDAKLNYGRNGLYYYGYDAEQEIPSADSIKQVYNRFGAQVRLENAEQEKFVYGVGLSYDLVSDKFTSKENNLVVDLNGGYLIDDKWRFDIFGQMIMSNYSNEFYDRDRTAVNVKPVLTYSPDRWTLDIGLSFFSQNDTIGPISQLAIYPFANFEYKLNEKVTLSTGFNSGLNVNTYAELTKENPFLSTMANLQNSSTMFDIHASAVMKVNSYMEFEGGVSVSGIDNQYFFVNDSLDRSRMNVVYDNGTTQQMNVFVATRFKKADLYSLAFRFDYNSYKTKNLEEAWHRPAYTLASDFGFKVNDQLRLGAAFGVLGGIKALDENGEIEDLKTILNLDLKADYSINEKWGAFVEIDNIIGQKNPYFLYYPTRGVQFLGGVSYSF
ncbi:oligogalacturonate-specific porin KdgM family protein [Aureibacter tunicatorum]|uniref:TonB-dependent receptor n=1 Tax=Aureibacter tunicatorum TaxID=866807 RepID=A0AAE3XN76_9BACT|nr:oligogalacturonate-specific porin KdgM family protein [Aureibacter tunicatorum]MDR6239600.1 hypothetical protein [Aureibacter tunicatorum]